MDLTVKPYIILSASTAELLEEKVVKALHEGYAPLGGVAAMYSDCRSGTVAFHQAMQSKTTV